MTTLVVAVIVTVVGLSAGLAIRSAALCRGANRVEASRSWRRAVSIALLVGAAVLVVVASTEDHRRYLSFAVAAFIVIAAVWQLRDVRREVRNP
jgi:hypothetical protein